MGESLRGRRTEVGGGGGAVAEPPHGSELAMAMDLRGGSKEGRGRRQRDRGRAEAAAFSASSLRGRTPVTRGITGGVP